MQRKSTLLPGTSINRRQFVRESAILASAGIAATAAAEFQTTATKIVFPAEDSLVHPPEWESLNPGYWKVENGKLRRRLTNIGDRARKNWLPVSLRIEGRRNADGL